MIANLGLSVPTDQEPSSIIGVLPYISPEVLNGKPYTIASDIYSFGVLMSVISTGQQPFYNIAHDRDLAFKICEGVRPGFSINTPKFYIELAYKCMDANLDNRPTTEEIHKIIDSWYSTYSYSIIENEFKEMDKIEFD